MQPPLHGLRIVATIPPHTWFGGVDFNFAIEMADELRRLGATVFDLHTAGFITRNELYIDQALEALKSFRPEVAVSLPNAGYGLLCVTLENRNIFKDILAIPTVMLWDHGLLQFPKLILDPFPKSPAGAEPGSILRLRQALDHPLYLHYSPDAGQIGVLDRLGVVNRRNVRFFLQPAYPNFVRYGYRTPPQNALRTRVAFAGNVYLQASRALPFRNDPQLTGIEERVLAAKKGDITRCLWDLLQAEIENLSPRTRRELRLDPDSTFFWSYLHDEIELVGNTDVRLAILTGLQREYEFFGNFIEPGAVDSLRGKYRMKFRKSLDYFTELPLLFMNSDLIVDVINLGYNSGISPKVMGCMACGGLVLFDYKDDFYRSVGEIANDVMYRSVDHLNALVEEYLANPRKRRDVARYLQHRVCTEFSFGALCKRIFADEAAWRN
ncbi:MAG: glycosyltransferase [Acidobacteriia bacterium]|nr:glycosyltransferase [Terriglobia bacterium]